MSAAVTAVLLMVFPLSISLFAPNCEALPNGLHTPSRHHYRPPPAIEQPAFPRTFLRCRLWLCRPARQLADRSSMDRDDIDHQQGSLRHKAGIFGAAASQSAD